VRLVVWNLCGATDRKWPHLRALHPSLAVLPEVAREPRALRGGGLVPAEATWHWVGANASRGLAVATFAIPSVPLQVPVAGRWSVGARADHLHAVGVWSCPSSGGAPAYVAEVRRSVDAYAAWLSAPGPRILAGDFNIMGTGGTAAAFRRLVDQLGELGLRSAYHAFHEEPFGAETRPTYFHLRHQARPFHIDFCFLSEDLLARVTHVEVGTWAAWVDKAAAGVSDHVPLVVDLGSAPPR
jgi:endonuclease/exonuclease/phosphatase family metal-dependent hydrolase